MRRPAPRHHAFALATLSLALAVAGQGIAQASEAPAAADPHAAHRHMMETAASSNVKRTVTNYAVPHLSLVRADGARVSLDEELNDGRPVVLNFIFTTCTTICPLTSQVFSMLQHKLGEDRSKVHLVSISIDPEQDTPARLRAYAARFKAGADWQHYTGTVQASIAAQQAFAAYQGDKSNHQPVTLVRAAAGGSWVRLDGFATADDLYDAVRGQLEAAR
jgi:protein SCO1/2